MNPGPVRDNKRHWTNTKDCSKGEGPIVNEDLHEKEDYNSRGRARGLTFSNKQHWSVCSKGERPTRDGKHSRDRGAKTGEKRPGGMTGRPEELKQTVPLHNVM